MTARNATITRQPVRDPRQMFQLINTCMNNLTMLKELSRKTLMSYMQKRQNKLGPRRGKRDGRMMTAAMGRMEKGGGQYRAYKAVVRLGTLTPHK